MSNIIKTIEKRLKRGSFSYRGGKRPFFGHELNVYALYWSRNLVNGLRIEVDNHIFLTWDTDLHKLEINN